MIAIRQQLILCKACSQVRDTLYSIIQGKDRIISNLEQIASNTEGEMARRDKNAQRTFRELKQRVFWSYFRGAFIGLSIGAAGAVWMLR